MATGRGDALLQGAHLIGQVRLVSHGGRHTTQQGGHLRTSLGETEDVVDEQQHVLVLHVTEVLSHGQCGQRHAQTGTRLLIHLAEDQCGLLEHAGLAHLADQIVTLTGTLTNAGEHGHTAVVLGHALNHFLNQHGLAHTCTTEQTDLATLHVRGQQVNDLDARLEHLGLGLQLIEGRRVAVDRPTLGDGDGLIRLLVEDVAGHVEDVALGHIADRHGNRGSGVGDQSATDQAVGRLQGDATNRGITEVLFDLKGDFSDLCLALFLGAGVDDLYFQGVVDVGQMTHREFNVDNRALDAGDATVGRLGRCGLVVSHMRSYSSSLFSASALPMISVSSWVIEA